MTIDLPSVMVELSRTLEAAGIGHAFGGALALAWCTERARGTIDLDVNCFISLEEIDRLLTALPAGFNRDEQAVQLLRSTGQARFFWGPIPVDLFCNTTAFHDGLERRVRVEHFAGAQVPFLSCTDLAVFKAMFNRPKDWVDLQEVVNAGTCDHDVVAGVLVRYLGVDDERVDRFLRLIELAE
jgi:hypothetical protein